MNKKVVLKGTLAFLVNANKEKTNMSIPIDKDREFAVGDIFLWNEDWDNHSTIPFVVVGWNEIFPLVVEVKLDYN